MTTKSRQPTVYVIAGPNGAGKTTFATEFLPNFVSCREFLNADLIAAGLSPFAPETQNVRAGRLLLERIRELAKGRRDFGFETTLAGRIHVKLLSGMRQWGYQIALFFLWLPSATWRYAASPNVCRKEATACPKRTSGAAIAGDFGISFACMVRRSIHGGFTTRPRCRPRSSLNLKMESRSPSSRAISRDPQIHRGEAR